MSTGYLYVPNEFGRSVSVIDTSTDSVVATIPLAVTTPDGTAVSPDGTFVYVASESGFISVIDSASNMVTATIPVGSSADFVAFSPDGTRAYVTHYGRNYVSVIDTTTKSLITNVTTGLGTYSVAVSPDGSHAYVTNEFSGTVSVIDTVTISVIATVNVGGAPTVVAVSPDGTHVYANVISNGTVSVIDPASNTVMATINVGGSPYGVVFSPDGSHAYVATGDGISVIDTATNSVTTSFHAGPHAGGVAISPDGDHLYVSNFGDSNTVTVVDLATGTIEATIVVGSGPEYLAMGSLPPAPQLSLAVDSGLLNTDHLTNVGTVTINGLLSGAAWQYSTDGTTWINGTGTSLTLTGDGSKTVEVHQTNGAHVTSNDSSFTFVLDTTPPAITESLNNDTGRATDKITSIPTLTGSGDPNAVVSFRVDGTPITTTATADSLGHWSFTPAGLSEGQHTILASETDAAGNTGTASLTFTLDTIAPVVAISSDTLNRNGSFTLTGTGEAGNSIKIYDGSTLLGTTTAGGNGQWSFTSNALSKTAIHNFASTATDVAGNIGQSTGAAVYATNGSDKIYGTPGNDILTGAGAADTFVFAKAAFGKDTVSDFAASGGGHDILQFDHSVFASSAAALAHAAQVGPNVVITYDAADTVTLVGVSLHNLSVHDFQIV